MEIIPQALAPVLLLKPSRFGDARGYFSELYSRRTMALYGFNFNFVQDNFSLSAKRGTVRGLHFQAGPSEQTKLVSVLGGAILDVAVDLRVGSPSYGRHVAAELTAESGLQMLVPRGFAHGFCTLTPNARVYYKADAFYDRAVDFGLRWNDPALAIAWPVSEREAEVSPKDRGQPLLKDLPQYFAYRSEA